MKKNRTFKNANNFNMAQIENLRRKFEILEESHIQIKRTYELTIQVINETLAEEISAQRRTQYTEWLNIVSEELVNLERQEEKEREKLTNELCDLLGSI